MKVFLGTLSLLMVLGIATNLCAQPGTFDTVRIKGSPAELTFDGGDDDAREFRFFNDDGSETLDLDSFDGDNCIMQVDRFAPARSLELQELGVGIGTNIPEQTLHIFGGGAADPFAKGTVLIEDNRSTTLSRALLFLRNNGGCRINFTNTDSSKAVALIQSTTDDFSIKNSNKELKLTDGGELLFKFGNQLNFRLKANGDLAIKGTLSQSSDRELKANFKDLDRQDVLDKVMKLPITSWNFKEDESVRHIGPMAQDFRAAFGLGTDDKTIAPIDTNGVSLVAIQALHEQLQARDKQIVALEAQLKKQAEAIQQQQAFSAAIVERLEKLESTAIGTVLTSTGR